MLRQAENKVKIEGILSEINLKLGSFVKDGKTVETIGGSITVQVDQQIDGVPTTLEIPVHMFSQKLTSKGTENPSYTSLLSVMNDFISIPIAATSGKSPEKVRITGARIQMNEYIGQNGQLISYPRVYTSFVSRATGEFKPEATFSAEFLVSNIGYALDREGNEIEPKKLEVTAVMPLYGGKVDVVKFVATSPNVISAIENYWTANETFVANGRLNFTSETRVETTAVDFGEPTERVITSTLSELVITGGSQTPKEGDFAFDVNEIKQALAERKERLNAKKQEGVQKKAPAPAIVNANDLGF